MKYVTDPEIVKEETVQAKGAKECDKESNFSQRKANIHVLQSNTSFTTLSICMLNASIALH